MSLKINEYLERTGNVQEGDGGGPTSHTPAHDTDATVAPFRAWRGLRLLVARGPAGPPQQGGHYPYIRRHDNHSAKLKSVIHV